MVLMTRGAPNERSGYGSRPGAGPGTDRHRAVINAAPVSNGAGGVAYLGLCAQCGLADPRSRLDVYDGFFYCTGCWQHYETAALRFGANEVFHRQLVEASVLEVKTDVSSYVQKFKAQQKNAARKIVSFAEDVVTDAGDTWKLCKEETKRHIVLVIDTSGSMRLCDVNVFDRLVPRIEAVRLTALEFLAAQEDAAVYSVVTFDHVAKVLATRASRDDVYEQIRHARFFARRTTEYASGLSSAVALAEEGDLLELVLLSDGRPGDPHKALALLQGELAGTSAGALRVHAIGLDPSATQYLQQLAAVSDGSYVESGRSLVCMRRAFTSVSTAIATGTSKQRGEKIPKAISFEVPTTALGQELTCTRYWHFFDGSDFTEHATPERSVHLRERPFTQGGMRLVHGFLDATLPQVKPHRMVGKLSKFRDQDTADFTKAAANSVAVAKFFVRCFEHAGATALVTRGLKFIVLECYRYVAEDGTSFVGERYLPGAFTKFNSNNGYVDKEHPLSEAVQALSHFSYQASEGEMMIADLQGVVAGSPHRCFCFFTDPQVLSVRKCFGPADLGPAGMRKFFAHHKCGPTCEALGLKANPTEDFEFVPSESLGCGSSVLSQILSDAEDSPSDAHSAATSSAGEWDLV
jgi:Mg-chelatase subunit ChlD